MKKVYTLPFLLLLLLSLLTSTHIFAQNTGDYRTRSDGNWNSADTWETYNGAAWVNAATPPQGNSVRAINLKHGVIVVDATNVSSSTNPSTSASTTRNIGQGLPPGNLGGAASSARKSC